MGYYETYEDGKERWVAEPGDALNIHGVSYDPGDPWSQWINAQGQLDVPNWDQNLANAQRLVEAQGLPFGANEQRGGYSRWFDPSTGEWPTEYHARQENAGPFGLPSWVAPLMALAAVGTAGAGSALLAPGAGAAAGAASAGSAAAAPAAASAASVLGIPTSTLGTIGTIGSLGGTAANVLGGLTGQEWLQKLGLGLGVAGGLSGGLAGLGNVFQSGIGSLSDAAKLASSAGKITGAVGRAADLDPLKQTSRYLGYGGNLGNLARGADDWLGWSGNNAPLSANVAPQVDRNVSNLLSAADVATQRGGGDVADFDYSWDYGGSAPYDNWSWDAGAIAPGSGFTPDYSYDYGGQQPYDNWSGSGGAGGLSLEEQVRQGIAGRPDLYGSASTPQAGSMWGTLGSLGSGALKMLLGGAGGGTGAGALGPLLSSLGSIGGGAIGSNAANEAARLQAAALDRGLSLQEAQWLQSQANQAPWMAAGREALGHMAGRSTWDQPTLGQLAPISGANYALPNATPGWSPQTMDANAYRWTPGQGPQAANYQYRPGQIPDASAYQSGPPQLYQGAMPGTQVPTLTGQQVLDQDPGAAFRQSEARKALEGSAAARGDLLSGGTLQALQSRSQDLAAQEYQSAWQRMMARDTEQYGRNWGQYQQNWNQGVQGTQLGLATNAQNFGQAMSAAQLREQVNQVASQQGWSQAQAESAFREAMAQQASQQGWNQSLQGQQWNQQQAQQYQQELYNRMLQNNQLQYNRDWQSTEAQNQRLMDAYNAQRQGQNTAWNQLASLAGLGQTSVGQLGQLGQANAQQQGSLLGQLGTAEGAGAAGSGLMWNRALTGAANQLPSILANLNA